MGGDALKVGQVVQLVSGGPKMTVHSMTMGRATCKWFDRHGNLKRGEFQAKGLVRLSSDLGSELDDYGASLTLGIGKELGALLTLDEILSLAGDVVAKHDGRPLLWPDRPLKPSKSAPDRIIRVTEDRCPSEPDVWFSWDDMPGICAVMPMFLLREVKEDRKARNDARGGRYVSGICEVLGVRLTLDEILALATWCYVQYRGDTSQKAEAITDGNHGRFWEFRIGSEIYTFDVDDLERAMRNGSQESGADVPAMNTEPRLHGKSVDNDDRGPCHER